MLVRLFDPVMQFQIKGGALNTAGRLVVYLEGTDDLAQIYSDEEGHVPLSQPAILDNNGRSRGLYVESGIKYRLAVHTNHGSLLFTVRNMVPVGGGGGGGQSLSASLPLKIENGTITNNGTGNICTGEYAWAEGHNTTASGEHSHAEGSETIASGSNTHAEGAATKATHPHAHAEGFHTEATATSAHAEGSGAKATTTTAHAEGQDTVASGDASHAQGRNSVASGAYSHASGYGTRATGQGSHAVGKYNDDGSALFVVGNGSGPNNRKDVFKVDANGDSWIKINGVLTKVTNVTEDCQFVLRRENMISPFTGDEYRACINEVNAYHSVVVQFGGDGFNEAQLVKIGNDGALRFSRCAGDVIVTYVVAPGQIHSITIEANQLPHPDAELTIRAGGVDYNYVPTGNSTFINIDSAYSSPYIAKGGASVATLNGTISGLQPGWCYTLTDSGILTAGNLTVHENDLVCWNGSKWYRIIPQYLIDRFIGGNSYDLMYAVLDADGKVIIGVNTEGDQFCTELSQYWFKHYWDSNNSLHYERTSDLVFAVTDYQDKVIFGITQDGEFYLESQVIEPVLKHFTDNSSEFAFCILDSDNKVLFSIDKNGKYSIEHQVDDIIDNHFANVSHLVFAVCDAEQKILFSIDKFGRIASDLLDDYIEDKLKDFTPIDTAYVDAKVSEEQTRAENAEQSLRQAIDDINPTTVIGGTNNPDEEYLTSISGKITPKNNTNLTNSRSIVYVGKNDDLPTVFVQTDTTYIVRFVHNLNSAILTMPSGCTILFDSGCFYNGTLDGDDTIILSNASRCFGSNLSFSGTFNVPVIEAEYFVNPESVNRLKDIDVLMSEAHHNTVILNSGHTYYFEPLHDGSWNSPPDTLINLKSNTELRIDGTLSVVPNGFTHYFAICARDASDVRITGNGKITGDADTHDYSTISSSHEWCHGICVVNNSRNVRIDGLKIENMPGDGIDVDGSKNPNDGTELVVSDVIIQNVTISHCGRQGISIESVENCSIENCDITDIYRTAPMAAIDIEPWASKRAKNIKISNVKFDGAFGIDVSHADNIKITNIESDNTRLLSLNDCSNLSVENCSIVNTAPNKTLIEVFGTVQNGTLRNITCDCLYPTNVQLDGILIDQSVNFGSSSTITSGPATGSTRIYNNQYQYFDGSNWTTL